MTLLLHYHPHPHPPNLVRSLLPITTNVFTRISLRPSVHRDVLFHRNRIACRAQGSSDEEEEKDRFYMRRSVELARTAVGHTSPNPMVGCVIVKDGLVVGEGFHPKAGQPHAEVFALRGAGALAESATAYVSLEPCNHYGRTPPCTEALIRAKVKRVVVGMVDPNPIVASKGVERLRDSGIEVMVGVEESLCKKLNEAYIHKMLTGKTLVTLRYSLSSDHKILDGLGKGAYEPGGYYSQLLQEYDAVVISSNSSAIKSTKFPTSQEVGAKQPLQIIVAGSTNSTFQLPVFPSDIGSRTAVFLEKNAQIDLRTENMINQQGIELLRFDKVTLCTLLDYCSNRGMCSVLFDLRSSDDCDWLIKEGLEEKLLKKIVMEVSPDFRQGEEVACIELGWSTVNIKEMQSKIVNETVLIEGYIS